MTESSAKNEFQAGDRVRPRGWNKPTSIPAYASLEGTVVTDGCTRVPGLPGPFLEVQWDCDGGKVSYERPGNLTAAPSNPAD